MRTVILAILLLSTALLAAQKEIIVTDAVGESLDRLVFSAEGFESKVIENQSRVVFDNNEVNNIWSVEAQGYVEETFMPMNVDTLLMFLASTIGDIVVTDFSTRGNTFFGGVDQLNNPLDLSLQGTANELNFLTGIFVDGSLGEIASRVYTRGLSVNADDDIGWYYVSLQEDGLPISAVQYNYFAPDFFHRTDLADSQVEFIRGGKASILSPNAPGGIINYISQDENHSNRKSFKTTVGLEGNNPYGRLDGLWNADISESTSLLLSGHYRYADGHRDTPYAWSQGGQLKARLYHNFDKGIIRFGVKYLNDRTNRYTGMTATNWNNPQAAFGQSLNSTALMMPAVRLNIPGGPDFDNGEGSYEYDSSNGIHTTELAFNLGLDYQVGLWDLGIKAKYSAKQIDWQTSFSNARMQLDDATPYFISGAAFPLGNVAFRDAITKEQIAVVNNSEIFSGGGYSYISGSLPNDALMGIAPWKKDDSLDDLMLQIVGNREFTSGTLSLGAFWSQSELGYFTNASAAYVTFEANPRLLEVSLQDFSGEEQSLSDGNGISNYGGLFFENGSIASLQSSLFAHYNHTLNYNLEFEVGARYEYINHTGSQVIPMRFGGDIGGADGDLSTAYDQSILVPSEDSNDYDFSYHNQSTSVGIAYHEGSHEAFARLSLSKKAPELNYYITYESDFEKGISEDILQAELGYGISKSSFNASGVAFYSRQSNVAKSDFGQDEMTQQIFRLPIQLIDANTIGFELDWTVRLSKLISLSGQHTIQQSNAIDYSVVNANGTISTEDDTFSDFSENELPHVPNAMHRISLDFKGNAWMARASIFHMGSRFGNIENSFEMGAYQTLDLSLGYQLSKKCIISVNGQNVLNSAGIANFFGPNTFGASANNATAEYISANPSGDFVVFPILPRSIYLSLRYDI